MDRFEHGGDTLAYPGVLDFSANLNPLGMPECVRQTLRKNVDAFAAYPDPRCRVLTSAIASYEGVAESMVLATAGATDAITRLCQALRPRRALLIAPCYSGYEQALEQVGCDIAWSHLSREDGFELPTRLDDAITEDIDLVFLANPNNPTGRMVERGQLLRCLEQARKSHAVVALDECFVDLTDHRGSSDLIAGNSHLVLVKAQTKTFALAGLRVGYALCSDARLLRRMADAGQPWAVSVPAQLAGAACAETGDYLERSRQLIAGERNRLLRALFDAGLHPLSGEANFLLFEGPLGLREKLLERGVCVRSCDNYEGLDGHWYRIAVRTPHENDQLISALQEVCSCRQSH